MIRSYKLLAKSDKYDPEHDYLKFSESSWVVSQAEFYFVSGGPYSVLKSNMARLKEASLLRNRVAHASTKAKNDFKKVALAYLNPSGTSVGQGFRVGQLLSTKAERHFGESAKSSDYFKAFCTLFQDMSKAICP